MQKKSLAQSILRAGTALSAFVILEAGLLSAPALAQDTGTQGESTEPENQDQATDNAPQVGTEASAVPVQNVNEGSTNDEIVVTGTLFRRTNSETPSPVTVLTSESLARRGITNVNDAVRSVSADNAGSIPSSFTNGFGAGGAAASLRGLTVNSTLTLIDGLRMVTYPLADDGQRAFVDLNTIPRVAIERIEVLKDGASSTYGTDAIGGVVNIITRKYFNGVDATAEVGRTFRGDGNHYRASILGGMGDYEGRGFNIYAGFEFESNGAVFTRDRGFPFNTADLTSIGGLNLNRAPWINTGSNNNSNPVAVVVPALQADPTNPLTGVQIGGGASVVLNPSQCDIFGGTIVPGLNGGDTCATNQFETEPLTLQPKSSRFGGTVRASVRLDDSTEAYLMGSFYRSKAEIYPQSQRVRSTNPVNTQGISLPSLLADGTLNPQNPFNFVDNELGGTPAPCVGTVAGCPAALLRFRFPNIDRVANLDSNAFRGAAGISGGFGNTWHWQVDASASTNNLRRSVTGNLHIPTLIQVLNQGTYNFADPLSTPDDVVNNLLRTVATSSTSQLYLAQGFISNDFAELAGGPLQVGVGAQIRHEELDNPNQNPGNTFVDVNQVFASGHRTVKAGFFEVNAPVIRQLELNLSGRYDSYSTGFSNFSPKAGFKFTPIQQLALRGTWSKGFRAPSFAEAGEGGVIGFTAPTPPCIVRIEHGATGNAETCTGGNLYVGPQALGFNTATNPDLDPEKSRNFTIGFVAQPIRPLSFTFDYYNIKKTDVITAGPLSQAAIDAFYARQPLPAGYSIVPYPIDPEFPNGIPVVAIVNGPYANAASIKTTGFDVSVLFQQRFSPSVRFSSQLEATKIIKFDFKPCGDSGDPACAVQHYAGTVGPYALSSGAGTPAWRGNWSNSLEFGRATLTATTYYVSKYKSIGEDNSGAGTLDDCSNAVYTEDFCHTKKFIWTDLVGSYRFTDWVTGYFNILNLFDKKAPIEPGNYAGAAANYNPTWHQTGAIGRAWRIGANFSFRPRPAMLAPEPIIAPPPPPPAPPPATQTCPDGSVILATDVCPAPPPPPPPPPPAPERG